MSHQLELRKGINKMKIAMKKDYRQDVKCSDSVVKVFKAILEAESDHDQDKEHFWMLGLTSKNHIKMIELIHLGGLESSMVDIKTAFRPAVASGVRSVIFCHNYPSGDPKPSSSDMDVTKSLVWGGTVLGIDVLDHIIVGVQNGTSYSFADDGLIESARRQSPFKRDLF